MSPHPNVSHTARTVVLDLETCGIETAANYIDKPNVPGNYSKPESIAAWIKDVQPKEHQKLIDRAALDLDLARVVCLGYQDLSEPENALIVRSFKTEAEEKAGLSWLFSMLEDARIVTFNGLKYDLPLLARRAAYLELKPFRPNLDRYRTPHVDVWDALTYHGSVQAHGLSWYIKRLNWTDLEETIESAEIPNAVRKGEWPLIEQHCQVDLIATTRLAQWAGLL